MIVADPPGPPINLEASDVTKTSCKLTWEPPEFDGGRPVSGYYVEVSSGSRWKRVNKKATKKLELEIDELIEGDTYQYRVCAENEAGVGEPCEPISIVAKDPFDPPSAPGRPEVTEKTAEHLMVTWAAPESDGGAPITNYIIEMREQGQSKWKRVAKDHTTDLSYPVTGCEKERAYEFRIIAENRAGEGPPSQPSEPAKYGKWKLLLNLIEMWDL